MKQHFANLIQHHDTHRITPTRNKINDLKTLTQTTLKKLFLPAKTPKKTLKNSEKSGEKRRKKHQKQWKSGEKR